MRFSLQSFGIFLTVFALLLIVGPPTLSYVQRKRESVELELQIEALKYRIQRERSRRLRILESMSPEERKRRREEALGEMIQEIERATESTSSDS